MMHGTLLGPAPRTDDPVTAPFWAALRDGRLDLQRCLQCDTVRAPPGPRCPHCGEAASCWHTMSGRAELVTWTVMHQRYFPDYGDGTPYAVLLVRLAEGPLLYSNLAGADHGTLSIGLPMEAVFDMATPDLGLVRFRPARRA
jgi:uncharacterized OB-fold protein